jgi:hypothetical protein
MKKIICNVLAYLFLVNPLMAATKGPATANGILDINLKPLTVEQVKEKFAKSGLNETELAEVNNYIDYAIENKVDPAQANTQLTAMLSGVSYTGASFDGEVILYTTLVIVLLAVLIADGGGSSSSSTWTCFADSGSYSAVGTGSSKSRAQDSALSTCAAYSFSWETCYSYQSDCY